LRRKLGLLFLLLMLPALGFAKSDLRLHGSNTVGAELAPALVEGWLAKKGYKNTERQELGPNKVRVVARNGAGGELSVELETLGSSTAFRSLKSGTADIGLASRPVKPTEVEQLRDLGTMDSPDCEYVVGLDGIAVIINRNNPLASMNTAQIAKIFSGEVSDWSEVGGKSGKIAVYALDDNSGTYDTFRHLVLGKHKLTGAAKRFIANRTVAAKVASDPNGIGFVGLPYAKGVKSIAIADGEARSIEPKAFTVATEDYALARRLYMYGPSAHRSPLANEFLDYVVSSDGQEIVDRVGFVSQNILVGDVRPDESMPEEYRKLIGDGKRLSVNFRFQKGTVKLDNKAHRDVGRLESFMKQPGHQGSMLMLFGFADRRESPLQAIQLSTQRADAVADLLIKAGIPPLRVRGYGAAVPVASNETQQGRYKNRRVEVWMLEK
jgi:phosphate transport system substrate-binding protein